MNAEGVDRGLIAVVALAAALFFVGLGWSPLWDEDETRFGSVAREMMRSGDWVVPRDNGSLADKPAGLFWMIAAGFALAGESPAGARLPSAVCGVAAVAMTWFLGAHLFGRRTAFWAAAAMSTALLAVVEARAATADSALLALITAMLLLAVRVWWRSGTFQFVALPRGVALAIGALAGVGVLLKGLVALVVPIAALITFLFWAGGSAGLPARLWSALRAMRLLTVIAVAVLVAAPWHLAVGWSTGGEWLALFYGKHHLGRVANVMEGHGGVPFLQVPWLFAGLFPWSVFLPLAAWRAVRLGVEGNAAAKLVVAWSAVWIVLFSLTATQLPNYVLPAYPALCIAIGHLLERAIECPASLKDGWLYAAGGGLAFGAVVIAGGFWIAAHLLADAWLRNLSWLGLVPAVAAAVLVSAVAGGRRLLAAGAVLLGGIALVAGIFLLAAPALAGFDPIPGMVKQADRTAAGQARLATWRYSAPGVVWHAARDVKRCRSAQEAAEFLGTSGPAPFVLIDAAGLDELSRAVQGKLVVVAEGRPPTRQHKVLLIAPR